MSATHHDGYERLLEDFGRQLEEAAARRPGGQPRRRVLAGALVLPAIVAALVIVLAGTGGGGHLGVLTGARAALAAPGQVVHLLTRSHTELRGGAHSQIVGPEAELSTPRSTERWSASNPTRWRIASTVPIVTSHGTAAGSVELSYGAGTEQLYIPLLNTLNVRNGVGEGGSARRLTEGPLGSEPVPRLRALLAAGQLRDAGAGSVGGRAVERLLGQEASAPGLPAHQPWPVEYDVDPTTFAPVRLTVEELGTSIAGNTGTPVTVLEVDSYEALPLNEDTVALLSIHPAGRPTVHTGR